MANKMTTADSMLTVRLLDDVRREMERQDEFHPAGYPATRDGVRLGIAAAEDELAETRDAWRSDRCKCPTPLCRHADWANVKTEAIQTASVLMRMVRSIDVAEGLVQEVAQ